MTPEKNAKQNDHKAENEARKKMYIQDQKKAAENSLVRLITCSFDLEKVLNTPCGKSMLFFYYRKYSVYNLTFYESSTRKVFYFTWGEKDGKRGSNGMCSVMEKYLFELEMRKINEVRLYCDNCAGQQKNRAMLSFLIHFLHKSIHLRKIILRPVQTMEHIPRQPRT